MVSATPVSDRNICVLLSCSTSVARYPNDMVITTVANAAMNGKYGESFIVYNPEFQKLKINESYTLQKDGNKVVTPENAFVEVLPSCAANAPAYNHLKEMVVVHTGLELGAKIVLDYIVETKAEMCGELDIFSMIKELSPIEDFRLTISVPESKKLNCELLNLSAKPSVSVANGMKTVSYSIKNIAPRPYSYPVYNSTVAVVTDQQIASISDHGIRHIHQSKIFLHFAELFFVFQIDQTVCRSSNPEGRMQFHGFLKQNPLCRYNFF